ncbi:hypothetical protein DFQ28_000742 [Apophysomyces sp. BC1034]|nr:hypothetical protein DFQ30_002169 [Apophysomyces sp. BC1015]KAG0191195.1 hypothetical protein DFQ28_000742 [Apophysomyces sp. BC1034]
MKPSRWISGTMMLWGIASLCQAFTQNAAGLIACRFWLGAFETGVGPSTPLFLSFWYQRDELALRVAVYFGASTIAGAFAGAIAYGVLGTLDGAHGLAGWRPESTGRWLTEDEMKVAVQRTRQSGNTDEKAFDKKQFFAALLDYKNWLAVLIYVGLNIALASYAVFLPTIIRDMGFGSLESQLLSIPPYVAAAILVFVYKTEDAPRYIKGHIVCLVFLCLAGSAAAVLRYLLKRENDRRDRQFGVPESTDLSELHDLEKLHDNHPCFRYAL